MPQPYGEGFTTKYEEVVNNYDLILYVANLSTKSNQTVVRIEWKQPMGADCGHYMNDIPTVFVSLENPYHCRISRASRLISTATAITTTACTS